MFDLWYAVIVINVWLLLLLMNSDPLFWQGQLNFYMAPMDLMMKIHCYAGSSLRFVHDYCSIDCIFREIVSIIMVNDNEKNGDMNHWKHDMYEIENILDI